MGDKLYIFSFKDGFKRARKKGGYTQKSFAEKFNISIETVRNWEQGRNVPEMETLEKLCNFFQCGVDYLLGNIECETHDKQFIHDYTGLSEDTIDKLNNHISFEWFSDILDKLISMMTFEYVLFHIFKYIDWLTLKKRLDCSFHEELEQAYSDEGGNYNGESEIEVKYHEADKEIEHNEFQINKWFMRTISLIAESIEKAPDTN